jgi:predicted ATPase
MLQEFTVDNYKSLINVSFRPRQQNLLLGMNNAGKTNLCQALMFVGMSARSPLVDCAQSIAGGPFGMTNFYLGKTTIDFHVKASVPFSLESREPEILTFRYDLSVSYQPARGAVPSEVLQVESESLRVSGVSLDEVEILLNTRSGGYRLLNETSHLRGAPDYVEGTIPRDATMLSRLYDSTAHPRAECFKRYLSRWQYYAITPLGWGTGYHPHHFVLSADGSNLASVIYDLKTTNEREYRNLLRYLKRIEPAAELINFSPPQQNYIFMYFEDRMGNRLVSENASPGTLRFLAMAYVLFCQPALSVSPLIIIEEPENGLYVGLFRDFVETLHEMSNGPQVIFTSHSPYFIDLFDAHPESVFVMKRGEKHSSLTQPDVATVKARLEKFSLGEQHFREMLG